MLTGSPRKDALRVAARNFCGIVTVPIGLLHRARQAMRERTTATGGRIREIASVVLAEFGRCLLRHRRASGGSRERGRRELVAKAGSHGSLGQFAWGVSARESVRKAVRGQAPLSSLALMQRGQSERPYLKGYGCVFFGVWQHPFPYAWNAGSMLNLLFILAVCSASHTHSVLRHEGETCSFTD